MSQDLSSIVVAFKTQALAGTPESGSGATGLEVLPSQGFQSQIAQIRSELLSRSRMQRKGRKGSEFFNYAADTELQVGAQNGIFEHVLGGTFASQATHDQSTLTSCAISGTGTTVTFAAGDLGAAGVRVGMVAKLASMTTAGNNGKWFPILGLSANGRVITTVSGILTDETADTNFTLTVAASLYTPTPYVKRLVTYEHYLADIDRSLLGSDGRFNSLGFAIQPDSTVKLNYGLGFAAMDMLASGSSPNFSSPTFVTAESLVPLDGSIYFGTTKRVNIASFNFSLTAPVSGLPLVSRKRSPDAFLGQFAFDGTFTGTIDDGADFDAFAAEDQVSAYFHFAELDAANPWAARFVSVYLGNLSWGGWNTPVGGEGAAVQTVPVNGGRDLRGGNYAATTMLISTSN